MSSIVRPLARSRSGATRVTSLVVPDRGGPGGTVPTAGTQGTLALQFPDAPSLLPRPEGRAGWQVVQGHRAELDAFAGRFSAAVVEVIGGDRGPRQLLRWTSEDVYEDLQQRSEALARATPVDQRVRRLRAQVRSVHLFCPSPEAAELSVHVRHGQRSRAIAARLEWRRQRWQCTALQFG